MAEEDPDTGIAMEQPDSAEAATTAKAPNSGN
jgi:hypothetical protein